MSKKKQKYYVVWVGKQTGVFSDWKECERQVKGVDSAKYKSFDTEEEARQAFDDGPDLYLTKSIRRVIEKKNIDLLALSEKPIYPSLAVDGACSGNPGMMEYRGVDAATEREIFHFGPVAGGTNNIGEFLAIVHALALLQRQAVEHPEKANELLSLPIYSDSVTAQSWVRKRKCATKLQPTAENEALFKVIARAENWLAVNKYSNPVIKWKSDIWGEIPADFGRK